MKINDNRISNESIFYLEYLTNMLTYFFNEIKTKNFLIIFFIKINFNFNY